MKTLALSNTNIISHLKLVLKEDGVCLVTQIDSNFDFLQFVSTLGTPSSHNLNNHFVWDVTVTNTQNTLARSLTSEAFSLHTDCSFEDPPPRYFALYVLHQDTLGGGETLLVDTQDIIGSSSHKLLTTLQTDFATKVPQEFYKGQELAELPILFGASHIRYRPECIDVSKCSSAQLEALDELESIIARQPVERLSLPQNSVIFVDNYRYLHGRTKVFDLERHLQRIRFN